MLKLLNRLFSDRSAREKWTAGLAWFRLRYLDAERTTRCLKLLSQPAFCGRVALYHLPGPEVTRLYLGLPTGQVEAAIRIAGDCGFSLVEAVEVSLPAVMPLLPAESLPWTREFVAHIVGEQAFVNEVGDMAGKGRYLPPTNGHAPTTWLLPEEPPLGITLQPEWPVQSPSAQLKEGANNSNGWPLGYTQEGTLLKVPGPVNVYGRQAAVADWLAQQALQMLATNPANLVIIDGAGDLVTQLKRKSAVTRLLNTKLTYLDLDAAGATNGLNPLAGVSGEPEAALISRWQHWFRGMGVPVSGVQLLESARVAGVTDIPALRKWLQQEERQRPQLGVTGLRLVLERLTADPVVQQWLEWPTNPFDILPAGVLLFACRDSGWQRRQLLRSVLLGVLAIPDVCVILHGFPWRVFSVDELGARKSVVIGNGPLLPDSNVVLTECEPKGTMALGARFLADDAHMREQLAVLGRGEGLLISRENTFLVAWNGGNGRADVAPDLLRL